MPGRDSGPKSVVVTSWLTPKRLMRTERARGDSGLEMNGAFRDKKARRPSSCGEEITLLPESPSSWLLFAEHLLSVMH